MNVYVKSASRGITLDWSNWVYSKRSLHPQPQVAREIHQYLLTYSPQITTAREILPPERKTMMDP